MTDAFNAPALFLSASLPNEDRDPRYSRTADLMAIQAAVSGLAAVVLGRRRLIWGGHPSITPMIRWAATANGIDYGRWVSLYQSDFYEADFPEDNRHFANVTVVPGVPNDEAASQALLRDAMLDGPEYFAAVFIGGMEGVEVEYERLSARLPPERLLTVASTGGAARILYERHGGSERLRDELTYVSLFRDLLDLPPL
ncbi:hypothetical protein [Brevundimonas diminuta]|uniref:SLOG domain-containing protein n=1 Tax=Brevundimonas diminuta TaxID=293 RepID=UPI003F7FA0FB